MSDLRSLPSVDALLQHEQALHWITGYGRPLVLEAIRTTLAETRRTYSSAAGIPTLDALLEQVRLTLNTWTAPTLQSVINATGVILQTNLGRAPLSQATILALQEAARDYSTLEYDLERGQRGSRQMHTEALMKRLTGAQAGMVVNNNAAAVLLILSSLARRRGVVIARSQLIEIGGGFRIPDVMKQSGARLIEVGTTNRVHLSDYQDALEEAPALILRAHRSNFRILGFTSEPSLPELASLAQKAGIPLVDDLGSGTLLETSHYGLGHEPTIQESLAGGADLVCFSGDKLLGGPQAGIILGRADLLARLKKHPLARAIRADKLCLAALNATLLHYLKNEAERCIPVWQMISMPIENIAGRAGHWASALGIGKVIEGESTIGGGSLPGETLPTRLLALRLPAPNRFLARLRQAQPPVIARLQDEQVVFDPRTVLPHQEEVLLTSIRTLLTQISEIQYLT